MTDLSEIELMHLCRRKSIRDFELLYDMYASSLYSITLTIIADEQLAFNSLQAAFCKIWQDLGQYEIGKMRLFTWMYQVTRSIALQYHQGTVDYPAATAA